VTAGVTESQSGVTESASGVTTGGVQTLIEPLLETNNRNMLFDEFWKEYPLKKDKGKAIKAFKSALTRASFDEVIAGTIAYRNDPQRKPEFTKFPATWLNADSWENEIAPSPDSEASRRAEERKQRDRESSQAYLAEIRQQAIIATPPVKCKHDLSLARCVPCAKEIG
jgi:hypothetical protein